MKQRVWISVVVLALVAGGVVGGEPCSCEPGTSCWWQRLRPAGGWLPYGGLGHWWNRCCFPPGGVADDYCRKPLPPLCWPPYPPYYKAIPQSCPPAEAGCKICMPEPAPPPLP